MAERIAVNTNVLRHDTGSIQNAVNTLKNISDGVYADVEELNGMWEGTAHLAMVLQFVQDYNYVKDTLIWLRNYIEELENAGKEYDQAENGIRELISALK